MTDTNPKLPNAGKVWLAEDLEQLKRLFRQGLDLEDICLEVGRTPSGVLAKLCGLGLLTPYGRYPGGGYHRVEADPWATEAQAREITRRMRET
ncbi:hypothetical protein H4CHR_02951 [Variovorax sp. PBS-H4]|uniref:hypothetical protein n=1 Tax=Variovorax sp. PBS-H4 TaxID=434008 RepID=UPI0013194FB2|nr:hypothetical protein [Variovorax sp. PBS-H4]VTU32143.1 hypothetical protein H4CHR_02951 [Variovorax sp. PBS-H4]